MRPNKTQNNVILKLKATSFWLPSLKHIKAPLFSSICEPYLVTILELLLFNLHHTAACCSMPSMLIIVFMPPFIIISRHFIVVHVIATLSRTSPIRIIPCLYYYCYWESHGCAASCSLESCPLFAPLLVDHGCSTPLLQ